MFTCPICNEKGIGFWSKLWSGSDSPSKCKLCGELSYVHSKYRFGFQSGYPTLAKILGAGLCLVILYQTNSLLSLAIFPFIWLSCSFWELANLPMRPIAKEQVEVAKKSGNLFVVALIIILLVVGVSNLYQAH